MVFLSIIRYSYFIHSLYKLNKFKNEENINIVNKNAQTCGPLAIKLLQLIIMRNNNFVGLDFVLEDCFIHPFEETKKLYFKDFQKNIEEDYIIEKVVGSGSIGQVYKAYCKETNEIIAIKVKHPCVNTNVRTMVYALWIICFFLKPINKFHDIIMEYINNIYLQINYTQEAKNTIKLKSHFDDEDCIIVPEIKKYSENFIFMSYHEGNLFKDVSEQSQLVASMYMNFFWMTSMVIHDFLHADLHFGNWKVIENKETGDVKLLVYDCGIICSTGCKQTNKEIIENTLNRRNFIKILDTIQRYNPKIRVNEHQRSQLNSVIRFDVPSTECYTNFLNKLNDLRLIKDNNLILVLTSIAIIGETPSKSIAAITKYIYSQLESNTILYHIYIGLLTKMNKFHKLRNYYINEINSNENYIHDYKEWLFEEFGHRNPNALNNIIYNKFFPSKD